MHPNIKHGTVILNEHSSNYQRVKQETDFLDFSKSVLPHGVDYIKTTADPAELADKLYNFDTTQSALIVAGGDGTVSSVGNIILSQAGRQVGLNRVPLLPARGGNANDIATMANGRDRIANALHHGSAVPVRPLAITVNGGDPRYALGYIGIGSTGAAARVLDARSRQSTRQHKGIVRLAGEGLTALRAARGQAPFRLQIGDAAQVVTDVICMRGNRMAKLGRSAASLVGSEFSLATHRLDGGLQTAGQMLRLATNQQAQSLESAVRFTVEGIHAGESSVPMQLDGETELLPLGSEVAITVAPHSYHLLTTKL